MTTFLARAATTFGLLAFGALLFVVLTATASTAVERQPGTGVVQEAFASSMLAQSGFSMAKDKLD